MKTILKKEISPLSFTSAHTFPSKLLLHSNKLLRGLFPIHLQLNLTNKCQLNCPFCSCKDRNKNLDMSDSMFYNMVSRFIEMGMLAVTVTGGGEPLLHPSFEKYMETLFRYNIKVGLVSNGIAIKKYPKSLYDQMAWVRISFDSYRKELPDIYDNMENLAFSYVYAKDSKDSEELKELIHMAENKELTHLRIVSDIKKSDDPEYKFLEDTVSTSSNVIVQNRSIYTHGMKDCLICLVKPVIDVDGLIYPCCGAQYAIQNSQAVYNDKLCMGTYDEYLDYNINRQIPFDGSVCDICYYNQYNVALSGFKLANKLDHVDFI